MGILLKNGLIVTQNNNRDVFQGDILINGDRIQKIDQKITGNQHRIIDVSDLVIIPGFIQSHVHICQTLFRNLADDMDLLSWLEKRIWLFENAHNENSIRASAKLGLAELLLGGTTGILDMGIDDFQDVIFEEMVASGIRGYSGKVMMDAGKQSYKEETSECLSSTERLIEKWNGIEKGRVRYALAPRFVPTCSNNLWRGIKELSEKYNLIIHTHAAENYKEWQLARQKSGFSNIEFFEKMGIASRRLCLAHCVFVSEKEMDLMAKRKIQVLHCPSANLKLGSGIAPVPRFLKKKINVSLGSDGAACNNNLDIFTEMRFAALIQKPKSGVTSINAREIFDLSNRGGAHALGLEKETGSLEGGKKADLVVLNLNKVHCIPADNIYSQIVYSSHASDILHVMIDGKWIVRDQKLLYQSQEEIMKNAWRETKNLFMRLNHN